MSFPEPWEMEGSNDQPPHLSAADRAEMQTAAGVAQSSFPEHLSNDFDRQGGDNQQPPMQQTIHQQGGNDGEEWNRVKYAIDHLKEGAPRVGDSGNETMLKMDAAAAAVVGEAGEEEDLWKSAMQRYNQESQSKIVVDNSPHAEIPPYDRMAGMDQLGGMEIEQSPQSMGGNLPPAAEEHGHLSLWQTFKVLYRRHPTIKYYIIGLLLLLIASAIILGVSLSKQNKNESSPGDCAAASWEDIPFLLYPEEAKLSAEGGGSMSIISPDAFGVSLAASSNYLIVGSPDLSCKTQNSNGGYSPCLNFTAGGAAYLYQRVKNKEEHWELYSNFFLDDGLTSGDQFGNSVSISEDSKTVAIGAPKDDGFGVTAGAVYVTESPFTSTIPPLRLIPDDIGVNDEFGGSVSVSRTTLNSDTSDIRVTNIVVGSSSDDEFGSNSGAAYVFSKYDDTPPVSACGGNAKVGKWVQCQKLLPDDGETLDRFGRMVDIADKTVVVGADWDDDRGIDSGSAYVYSLDDDGTWSLQQKLLPTNIDPTSDRFGVAVSTSGDRVVIGADLDDSQGNDSGAAYVYLISKGVWKLESKLLPSVGDYSGYHCGSSVDISSDGRTIAVGCPDAPGGGVVYVYSLQDEGKWVQKDKLTIPPSTYLPSQVKNLMLGHSVATTPGDEGIVVSGYGQLYGDVFSYSKKC